MSVFLSLLPIYLFGNAHCLGMCGPLVLMLGKHRYRHFYFLGRLISFTIAGIIAGGVGAVLDVILQAYHLSATVSFIFGGGLLAVGVREVMGLRQHFSFPRFSKISQTLSLLLLRDCPWATFLFGFFTIALPCGQTVVVYSACALSGDPVIGMLNGCAFALLTSPSLYLAMHAHSFLYWLKGYVHILIGLCAIVVGGLALCRGFAELGLLPHLILNPNASRDYHVVLF